MSGAYIEHLMVYPKLGRCDVSFRNGINVVWAEDVTKQKKNSADFRNSVGKTTFVHLIDYLFGSKKYIANPLGASAGIFIETVLLAEVKFSDKKFTISRRLIDGEENRVYDGWIIRELISGKNIKGKLLNLKEYNDFLNKEIYGDSIIINEKKYITNRSIMSYLIRDQFSGFSKFDSGISEENAAAKKKRLEFLLGLITPEKIELERKILELKNEKNKMLGERKTLKNYFDYISEESFSELKKRKKRLEKEFEKSIKKLETANLIKEKIDAKIDILENDYEIILNEIRIKEEEKYILENRSEEYQKAVNDIDNEKNKLDTLCMAYSLFAKIEYEKCPFYMQNVDVENGVCEYLNNQGENNIYKITEAREKIIQMERNELQDSIRRISGYIKQLEKVLNVANKSIEKNRKEKEKLEEERTEKYQKIQDENQKIQHDLELLAKDMRNFEYLEVLGKNIDKKNEEIKLKNESLEELQKNRAVELNECYSKVIKYITNDERFGEVNFQTYKPTVRYKNGTIDNGAGMKNAAIVAFDLAMLELTLKNQEVAECRPLILVHDSPKLHDLDLAIYYRIMDYVIDMEKTYAEKGKVFQYIITTLDISKNVTKKLDEYIRLRLDNSGEGGKLFGCTVNID